MKKIIYFISLIILHIYFSSYTMSIKNTLIGPIDALMIQRLLEKEGREKTEKKIKNHSFELWIPAIGNEHPFIITHCCYKNENKQLEQEVFKKIEEVKIKPYSTSNVSNQILITNNISFVALDECTIWKKEIDNISVNVSTFFYNQVALLRALERIKEL